jgi:3-deoxy-D-manno-octulosonic-acid transferase
MPLDFWWSIRRVVQWIRPSVFLLVETDLWPGILGCLQGQGTPSILVNGRISPRTLRAYRRFPVFVREVFRFLEECLMQSDLDVQRLVEVGVDPSKVKAVGNIKFDRWWEPMGTEERAHWMESLCLNPQNVVWVAGSTHRGEEEIILRTFGRLRPAFPNLRLIIAPRQVEQADEILRKASEMGLQAVLRTRLAQEASLYDVLVLNTLGELGRVYGLGKIAFVGGSLMPFGGHNLLEPASFGCPVLFGPHMHNFVTMSEALVEAGAGWRVPDEKALGEKVTILLEEQHLRDRMGKRARRFVQDNQGALEGVMQRVALYVEMPEGDLR